MPPHPLTNFEMQKYYQNEPRFIGVYSGDNLQKINPEAYIKLDEYSDIGTHWVFLYVENNDVTYFNFFRREHIPKEIRTFIGNKKQIFLECKHMIRYFSIGFIGFILAGKTLTKFTNLFSPKRFLKNDDIILNFFMTKV